MQFPSRLSVPEQARCATAVLMSLVLIAAGTALAKNHDAQRVDRQAAHAVNHDRATGPQEASNIPERDSD